MSQKLYKIMINKNDDYGWSRFSEDKNKYYDLESAESRLLELRGGVRDIRNKEKYPSLHNSPNWTPPNWEFKGEALTPNEYNELKKKMDAQDEELHVTEWQPFEIEKVDVP